jgi:hypothetical protein
LLYIFLFGKYTQPLNLVIFKEIKAYIPSNGILCKTVSHY